MLNEWCSSNNVVKDIKLYSHLGAAHGSLVSNRKTHVNSNNDILFLLDIWITLSCEGNQTTNLKLPLMVGLCKFAILFLCIYLCLIY